MRPLEVRLASNGDHWQASWVDANGKRRKRGLGSKKEVSKRKASALCRRLEADLREGLDVNARKSLRLADYIERYLTSRTDLSDGAKMLYRVTADDLLRHFGEDKRIAMITRADASDWRRAIATGPTGVARSEATICRHVREAKVIFGHAVRDDLLAFNPFDRLKGTPPNPDKSWKFVTREELGRLLAACPNDGWRALLGLCRLAGLRRGEALHLPWTGVDLDAWKITVFAQKTKRKRTLPIDPDLAPLLKAVHGNNERVVPCAMVSEHNLVKRLRDISLAAGIEPWKDAFQVLRRNREEEWASDGHPQHAVSEWMGHDIRVSQSHYLKVGEDLFARASGRIGLPQNLPQTDFATDAGIRKFLSWLMERTGIEPATPSLQS